MRGRRNENIVLLGLMDERPIRRDMERAQYLGAVPGVLQGLNLGRLKP